MNRSPTRNQFGSKRYIEKLEKDPHDENALLMIDYYNEADERDRKLAEDLEWRKNNLEYDLRTTEWIIEKAKSDKVYAQHMYAALCNNEFMHNSVWPILTDKKWSCSWRHAGAVISDMREEGDYMNWYCSGIRDSDPLDSEVFDSFSDQQKLAFYEIKAYVSESIVTEEIQQDLFKLGWIVVKNNDIDID